MPRLLGAAGLLPDPLEGLALQRQPLERPEPPPGPAEPPYRPWRPKEVPSPAKRLEGQAGAGWGSPAAFTPCTTVPPSPRLSVASTASLSEAESWAARPLSRSHSQPQVRPKATAGPLTARPARQPAVERFGGAAPASARQDCHRKLEALTEATKRASARFGAGHPEVKQARKRLQRLRSAQESLRWQELCKWHTLHIAAASSAVEDGASPCKLEEALKSARCSELGRAHDVVDNGTARALCLHKQRLQQEKEALDTEQARVVQAAQEYGSLASLIDTMEAGAASLGFAHPLVETARQAFKCQRSRLQRRHWDELVARHSEAVMAACTSEDSGLLEAALKAAVCDGIGLGHPLVLHGKDKLLQLRKDQRRGREERLQGQSQQQLRQLQLELERSLELWQLESEAQPVVATGSRAPSDPGQVRRPPFRPT